MIPDTVPIPGLFTSSSPEQISHLRINPMASPTLLPSHNHRPSGATVIIALTTAILTTHCGDAQLTMAEQPSHQPPLVFATDAEITSGAVAAHEYIVAFRHRPAPDLTHDDFTATLWQKNLDYYHDFVDTGLATDIHLLAALPFADPPSLHPSAMPHQAILPQFGQEDLNTLTMPPYTEISLLTFNSAHQARQVLTHLLQNNKIWFAEPNRITTLSAKEPTCASIEGETQKFNCTLQKYQSVKNYHITQTKVNKALDYIARLPNDVISRITKQPPIIAILDSGVDIKHPALHGRTADLTRSFPSKACGDFSRGCRVERDLKASQLPKDTLGDGQSYPIGATDYGQRCNLSNCGHGTQAAGLAVGFAPDQNIYGACPFCQIIPIKLTLSKKVDKNNAGAIKNDAIIRALQFVSLFRQDDNYVIRVINNSYGTPQHSRSVAMLTHTLSSHKHKGMVIVAAAGNEDSSYRRYPAGYGSVVSVANIDANQQKHTTSNYGKWVDIAAPGTELNTADPGGSSTATTGTSFSAPIVSGVAGLLLAINPEAEAKHIINTILNSADNGIYSSEINPDYSLRTRDLNYMVLLGRGLVDAEKAAKQVSGHVSNPNFNYRIGGGCASLGLAGARPPHHNQRRWWWFIWLICLPSGGFMLQRLTTPLRLF